MHKSLFIGGLIAWYLCACGFLVIGHRGAPTLYPEETFQSNDAAFAAGADYVELDIHESQDGTLVIQHDEDLTRMTGANRVIATTPFATLQQYHTKNGEPIHSLQQLFAHYQNSDKRFLIETKPQAGATDPQLEAKLAALVTQYHMEQRVMFHSFSLASLKRLKALLPDVPRILIVGSLKRITFAVFPEVDGINMASELVTPDLVAALHYVGQKVYVWDEMNESRTKWRWLANIDLDGVVTNYPALAAEFKVLTRQAHRRTVDTLATNTSTKTLPVVSNPYVPTLKKTTMAPGATMRVAQVVTSQNQTYYQIGANAFVAADTLNLAPKAGWAQLFVGQPVTVAASGLGVVTHTAPRLGSAQKTWLVNRTQARVQAVKVQARRVWFELPQGWVPAASVRYQPNLTTGRLWFTRFNQQTQTMRPQLGLGQTPDGVLLNLAQLGGAS